MDLENDLPGINEFPPLNIVDTVENSQRNVAGDDSRDIETQSHLPDLDAAERIDLPQEPKFTSASAIKQHACSNDNVWEQNVDIKGGDIQPRAKGERYHVKSTRSVAHSWTPK